MDCGKRSEDRSEGSGAVRAGLLHPASGTRTLSKPTNCVKLRAWRGRHRFERGSSRRGPLLRDRIGSTGDRSGSATDSEKNLR
jgi:hypothetical protein